jgi:WD40 repeat protein
VSQSPVRLIQLSDGKVLSTFPHETATGVASLCFDETGQQLWMTRGEHATIRDIATLKQVGEFPAVRRIAANLSASPDGRYVAVVQNSGPGFLAAVTVLDRKAQKPEWRALPGMRASARLAWHPRQPWLATYSDSGILRVWDIDKFLTK